MKRIILIFSCILLFSITPLSVYASDNNDSSGASITVVIPQKETKPASTTPVPKPTNYLYPISVWETQDNGRREVIKTYELGAGEKPEDISRESFTRNGWLYELTDITKKETASADVREHTETKEIGTETKDMDAIIKLLAPAMEYQSDDGYIGVLTLDIASIKVETAGTKKSSYTVSATREYPHLSSNDTSLVPKTITDNGRTLTLTSVEWRTQSAEAVDYSEIAASYTAVAKYTASASKTVVTGYTTTAEYKGTVSKILTGKTIYTAYFIGVQIVTPTFNKPNNSAATESKLPATNEKTFEPTGTPVPTKTETPSETESPTETEPTLEPETTTEPITKAEPEEKSFNPLSMIIVLLSGAGIGGGLAYFYLQKIKKPKEVITHEDEKTV